ncbi:MAG: RNA repair domain-containing protein [Myxococcota bacterium]
MTKERLATSREAYNRIKWDPSMDETAFVIGYRERSGRTKEVPLVEWSPDGDVPFHRVWYIRRGDVTVWDREARVDLVVEPDEDGSDALVGGRAVREGWREVHTKRFDPCKHQWVQYRVPDDVTRAPAPRHIRIITFNTLSDEHRHEAIDPRIRLPRLWELLDSRDADVIGLQEITPRMRQALCALAWVRERYLVTPGDVHLAPHGQLILSRLPMRAMIYAHSKSKRTLLGEIFAGGQLLTVPVVHLTSNWRDDARDKRTAQLGVVMDAVRTAQHVLFMGDVNMRPGEHDETWPKHGLEDVWRTLRPEDPGYTFSPSVNPIADFTSHSGEPARYDRVLVRSKDRCLKPRKISMLTRGFSDAWLSDHFGLEVECELVDPVQRLEPTALSALAILPPEDLMEDLGVHALRSAHDPKVGRWMPHVTLMHPFVQASSHHTTAAALVEVLAEHGAFELTLTGVETFEHPGSTTAYLACASGGQLEAIFAKLAEVLPQCAAQLDRFGTYTPHLTIASYKRRDEDAARAVRDFARAFTPATFVVDAIDWVTRPQNGSFATRERIYLDTASLEELWDTLYPEAASRDNARAQALRALEDLVGERGEVFVVGSHRLGVATPASDVDVIVEAGGQEQARAMGLELERAWPASEGSVRFVDGAVAMVRGTLSGVGVDAALVGRSAEHEWAWEGLELARIIEERMEALELTEDWRTLTRWLKTWAARRALDEAAWGYWGGVAWTVASAWALESRLWRGEVELGAPMDPGEELSRALDALALHEWPAPLRLGDARAVHLGHGAWMPVLSPAAPHSNLTHKMTRATAKALKAELWRAANIARMACARRARWDELLEPWSPERGSLELVLRAPSARVFDMGIGWVKRNALAWLLHMERRGLAPRPGAFGTSKPRSEGEVERRWRIGLSDAGARDAARLGEEFASWEGRPDGVTLESIWMED